MPLVGVLEKPSKEPSRSAVVMENWLDKPMKALEYAAVQREAVKAHAPGAEFMEEARYSASGLTDAHALRFRTTAAGGARLRQELIVAVEGPLAVSLTLTGLESDAGTWSRLFGGILGSFSIAAAPWARTIQRVSFAPKEPKSTGPSSSAPALQMTVPVAAGWKLDADAGTLRSPAGAEITIRRSGLPAASPDELFLEALVRAHRSPELRPRRWDRGVTRQNFPFFALESATVQAGNWVKKEQLAVREIFVQDHGPVVFRLQAPEGDTTSFEALGAAAFGYDILPPAERRLALRETWLRIDLPGAWTALGSGAYVKTSEPVTIVTAHRLPATPGLKAYADNAVRALSTAPEVQSVVRQESREGPHKGVPAWRYSLDFTNAAGTPSSVRAAWFEAGGAFYALTVRGQTGKDMDDLFARSLDGVDADALKQGR
jgi:hypothetical protein